MGQQVFSWLLERKSFGVDNDVTGNFPYVGDAILVVKTGYKVFDFEKHKVYWFVEERKREHIFSKLKLAFLPTSVEIFDEDYGVVVEKMLNSSKEDVISLYVRILKDLAMYYKSLDGRWDFENFTDGRQEIVDSGNEGFLELYDEVAELCRYREPLPIVLCHGDLNPWNVFIENGKLVYIDWEALNYSSVFTDIFHFFYELDKNVVVANIGILESAVRDVFAAVNLEFSSRCFKDYLLRWFLCYLRRSCPRSPKKNSDYVRVLHSRRKIFEEIKSLNLS